MLCCKNCLNWTLPSWDEEKQVTPKYRLPLCPNLQTSLDFLKELNNRPTWLSFSHMKLVWNECYDDLIFGRRSIPCVKSKLSLICLNANIIETFLKQCKNVIAKRELELGNPVFDEEARREITKQMQETPERFEKPLHPALWDICEMDDFIETPMHLSMGVIKAVSKLIHEYASKIGVASQLTDHMSGWITIMTKFCRVNSYRFASYSSENKFPGWVADTFRTWCKLMPWFYLCFHLESFQPKKFIVPNNNWKDWKKPTIEDYLRSRGIPIARGMKKAELLDLLRSNLLPNGNFPPAKETSLQKISPNDIQELVWHCHCIFKIAFDTEEVDETLDCQFEGHVKQFLSCLTKIDSALREHLPVLKKGKK